MTTPDKKAKRNKILAVLLVISPLLWTVPTFIYLRNITRAQNQQCEKTMREMGESFMTYASDNDDTLPPAKSWVKDINPYGPKSLKCPADTDKTHPVSYAMNMNLSGKKLSAIHDRAMTILLYESTSKDATPSGTGMDSVLVGKDTVGQGRHHTIAYRFSYFVTADGKVHWPKNRDELLKYKWTP